ncbi:v-type ATPase subunit family domain-containing protein [Ditylenchus destructor]|nr:v-type ATPase subunit family domain-containing protein [Ditylenchus destructor]
MIVQKDAAYACVVELGQKFNLGYIEKEVIDGGARDHIPPLDVTKTEVSLQREMWDLETRLYDLERDVRQFLQNEAQLKRNVNDLKQCKSVYEKVEAFFKVHIENTARTELDNDGEEINDVGKMINKSVFIIFFNGRKLQDIVNRVCDGFNAKQYSCPKTSKERQLALADILIGIHDLNLVIRTTEKHKLELLRGAAFELPEWVRQVHLQKCIFHTLNLFTFDTSGNFFVAECWVRERKMDDVLQTLQRGVETAGGTVRPIMNVIETGEVRPTYNRTNKFIQVFQNIVDSYGIASYPPFTIITFPFLFAVMFGDLGHGIILLLAGLSFILYEKKVQEMRIKDEIFNTFFGGRFIIVLMGFFSIYAGFMYNDAFSKSFNIFGSKWRSYFKKRRKGFINPETNEAYMNWYVKLLLLSNMNVRVTVDSEDVELIGADLASDVEHNGTAEAKGNKKKSKRSREGAKANAGEAEMVYVGDRSFHHGRSSNPDGRPVGRHWNQAGNVTQTNDANNNVTSSVQNTTQAAPTATTNATPTTTVKPSASTEAPVITSTKSSPTATTAASPLPDTTTASQLVSQGNTTIAPTASVTTQTPQTTSSTSMPPIDVDKQLPMEMNKRERIAWQQVSRKRKAAVPLADYSTAIIVVII